MRKNLLQRFCASVGILMLILTGATVHKAPAQPTYGTIQDLGAPIRLTYISAGNVGIGPDGDPLLYVIVRGKPAQFNVIDVQTGQVVNHFTIKGAFDSTDGAVTVTPDGTVYIATRRNGHIYKYRPGSHRLIDLGQPVPNQSVVFRLIHDENGTIYGSTYPGAHLFKYNSDTKKFTDFGPVAEGEKYGRSIGYDPRSSKVFIGTGVSAKLIAWDLDTGKKTDITGIIPSKGKASKIYDVKVISGQLFFNLNKGAGSYIISVDDIANGTAEKISYNSDPSPPVPGDSGKVLINVGDKLASFDLKTHDTEILTKPIGDILPGKFVKLSNPDFPGYTYVAPLYGNPRMLKYNLQRGTTKVSPLNLKGAPTFLNSMHKGPGGKIYIGGYKNGLSVYDPFSRKETYYAGIGQIEGMGTMKGNIYFGNYTSARILEYNPVLPWKPGGSGKAHNPEPLFNIGQGQDRPFAVLGVEKENKLFVGTVPTYGQFTGALSVYDFASAKFEVYTGIVEDQSVVALAYGDGMIFGGSSIYGGLGKSPIEKEAKLFIWDVSEAKKIYQTVPAPGKGAITALLKGPDNHIWGLAGGELFIFDPASRKIIATKTLSEITGLRWRGGYLQAGADGKIYSSVGGNLYRIDPETKEVTKLLDGDILFLTQDNFGNLYFRDAGKTNLLKYTNPDLTLGGLDEYIQKGAQMGKITNRQFAEKLQRGISNIQEKTEAGSELEITKELKVLQIVIQTQSGDYISAEFAIQLNDKITNLMDSYDK